MIFITFRIFSGDPTEVPPNFQTSIDNCFMIEIIRGRKYADFFELPGFVPLISNIYLKI